jgi:transcriptional regulator with XRE-family HTH domain
MPRTTPDEVEKNGREEWARRLCELLADQGRNRQWLAAEIGVSRAQLDKYADGRVTPPGKHLGAIADKLDFDVFEQLELLRWVSTHDARVARERRVEGRRQGIHQELQRLVRLDAELVGTRPAMSALDPLLRDGWVVRHWVDWRGRRRRISYFDILELTPPQRLRSLAADGDPGGLPAHESRSQLPAVDQAAYSGLTRGERRLREIAETVIGTDVFHGQECYWSERQRHVGEYRGRPAAAHPGLVLVVPWFLRRRYPGDTALPLVPRDDPKGTQFTSLAVLGLPYTGAPDVAGVLADEVLRWGCAGVAALTRERWHTYDRPGRARLEQETARAMARGTDPRAEFAVWFYNEPEALVDTVGLLATADRPAAVLHLRFSDNALRRFLLPEWGGVPGREVEDLFAWRDACDAAERAYRDRWPDDWKTVDVELTRALRGFDGEDARSDLYIVDLAAEAERWLGQRYEVRREPVLDEERSLLDVLARSTENELTDPSVAASLGITAAALKYRIENVMNRHGLGTREDLYSFAQALGAARGREDTSDRP